MRRIFLILIQVQRVLLALGSQEIMPFQVHSWLLCWGWWGFLRAGEVLFASLPLTQPEECHHHLMGRPLSPCLGKH